MESQVTFFTWPKFDGNIYSYTKFRLELDKFLTKNGLQNGSWDQLAMDIVSHCLPQMYGPLLVKGTGPQDFWTQIRKIMRKEAEVLKATQAAVSSLVQLLPLDPDPGGRVRYWQNLSSLAETAVAEGIANHFFNNDVLARVSKRKQIQQEWVNHFGELNWGDSPESTVRALKEIAKKAQSKLGAEAVHSPVAKKVAGTREGGSVGSNQAAVIEQTDRRKVSVTVGSEKENHLDKVAREKLQTPDEATNDLSQKGAAGKRNLEPEPKPGKAGVTGSKARRKKEPKPEPKMARQKWPEKKIKKPEPEQTEVRDSGAGSQIVLSKDLEKTAQINSLLDVLPEFEKETVNKRWKLTKKNDACFICLRIGHQAEECQEPGDCGEGCQDRQLRRAVRRSRRRGAVVAHPFTPPPTREGRKALSF